MRKILVMAIMGAVLPLCARQIHRVDTLSSLRARQIHSMERFNGLVGFEKKPSKYGNKDPFSHSKRKKTLKSFNHPIKEPSDPDRVVEEYFKEIHSKGPWSPPYMNILPDEYIYGDRSDKEKKKYERFKKDFERCEKMRSKGQCSSCMEKVLNGDKDPFGEEVPFNKEKIIKEYEELKVPPYLPIKGPSNPSSSYKTTVCENSCWSFGEGNSALLSLVFTSKGPKVGAYYVHHFGGRPIGYFSMIGLTSFRPSVGIGYDVNRHFGLQAILTTGHKPLALGVGFRF